MRSLYFVAAFGAACSAAAPAAVQKRVDVDIPAGSLQSAVIMLGRQTSSSIAISDPGLRSLAVRRVRGHYTAEQALRRLLSGSAATIVVVGDSSFRVVRARTSTRRPPKRASPPPAPAEPEQEIVVTGTKQRTLLRDYAGPAVLVTNEDLPALSPADGTQALVSRLTGLSSTHLGPGRNKLFIRGIADSSFNGQTQSTVGQYLGEARLNYNAADPDLRLYDMASVELLPGPQGTLYGAGSMGGVLRLVPNAPNPQSFTASMRASGGLTAHGDPSTEIAGVFNLPIADATAARLVAYDIVDGGYIDDLERKRDDVNRTRITGVRGMLTAAIGTGWQLEAGGAFQTIRGKDGQYADKSEPPLNRRSPFAQPFDNDYALAHATVRGSWDDFALVSTVAVADQDLSETYAFREADEPQLFHQRNQVRLLSMETRLSRELDAGSWVAGVAVLRNQGRLDRESGPPGKLAPLLGVRNIVDEQTLFGEASLGLGRIFHLTGGARLTHVRYQGSATDPPASLDESETRDARSQWRLLPSVALSVNPRADLSLYLRYQESFRPGGIIARSGITERLSSDHIAAIEAGARYGQRRGSVLSGAIGVAYSRWSNVQADLIDTVGLPSTANIGDGRIWTIDAQLAWNAAPGLKFSVDALFNDSEVTDPRPGLVTIDHEPLPNVADVNARLSVDYTRSILHGAELQLSGWLRYVGDSVLGYGPILGRTQGDYFDSGVSARIALGRTAVFASLTNLADVRGNRFSLGSIFSLVAGEQITPLRPFTARLGVEFKL